MWPDSEGRTANDGREAREFQPPPSARDGWYARGGKRALDLTLSLAVLLLILPLMLVVSGLVWLLLGRPVLFRQARPGLRGGLFALYKFRTMRNGRDPSGAVLPDSQRLTPFGRFLRSTSLDELPEFWNVLRGDMSLVGPRPLLTQYLDRYTPEQARRHDVRPGITGWAQVNGRNALTWEEKFKLDVWYVDNMSATVDGRIIFRTVARVVSRKGISADRHATMDEFQGAGSGKHAEAPRPTRRPDTELLSAAPPNCEPCGKPE